MDINSIKDLFSLPAAMAAYFLKFNILTEINPNSYVKYALADVSSNSSEFSIITKSLFEEHIRNSILNIYILIAAFIIILFFIKNFFTETKQKNKIKDLSENVQQKVDEQIREIRKAYEIEKKNRVELEQLSKTQSQYIMNAQHHLRTPLTILKGYVMILHEKFVHVENARPTIEKIYESTERLGRLVNQFLDISEIQINKNLHLELTNIKNLIASVLREFQLEIDAKHIKITFEPPAKEEDNLITIDKEKINVVLVDIIDNSIKYNKEDGEIKIKIERTKHPIEEGKDIMRIIIEDTGIGITEGELSKLFVSYFERGEEAQRIHESGRGMGLAIAKSIVQAHQGSIHAESQGRGTGSKLIIEIPDNKLMLDAQIQSNNQKSE
jgi:signal transduction histidine kinase